MRASAACGFFTVPTLAFKLLYVFVALSCDRRRIVHVNVTTARKTLIVRYANNVNALFSTITPGIEVGSFPR